MQYSEHNGQEFVLILAGALEVFIHGKEELLNEGDSIYFDGPQRVVTVKTAFFNGFNHLVNTYCMMLAPIFKAFSRISSESLCTRWSSQPSPRSHS